MSDSKIFAALCAFLGALLANSAFLLFSAYCLHRWWELGWLTATAGAFLMLGFSTYVTEPFIVAWKAGRK